MTSAIANPPVMLAALVTPALFWGGAAAVAAPILIHLLARRRFKRIRWAAMDFLVDAERRNRRRINMEDWILLLLRCLAILLIALMLARPFIKPAGAASLWVGSRQTERVFVLDDSLSMTYETAGSTPFDRAKTAARRVLAAVRRETPDDPVTILRMTEPTTPIESGTYLDSQQTEELLGRLEALAPTQRAIDAEVVVSGIADVLERSPGITSAAIYIISDFQRKDWVDRFDRSTGRPRELGESRESTEPTGLFGPIRDWTTGDRAAVVTLIDVSPDEPANRTVTAVDVRAGKLVAGTTAVVRAGIANFSDSPAVQIELQLSVGHFPQPSKTIRELSAQQEVSVDLDAEFPRVGFESVRIDLPADALTADDVRFAVVDVAEAIHVLIVNGEPSTEAYDDEVTFLATALGPEGELFSGVRTTIIDEAQLEEVNLASHHVVLLANVYRLSAPAVESLEGFVRRGGGLVVFLGDQVDADLYNAALFRDGEGLLPGALSQPVRAPQPSHLMVVDRLHPAMRGLSKEGDPLGIGQIPFFEYFAVKPIAADDTMPADADRTEAGETRHQPIANVVARFDDANELPAILERSFGRGRVLLVATAVDKEWHLWPDHPTYLPVIMELVRHCAGRGDAGREYRVGEPIEIPLDPAEFEPDALLRTPLYPDEREIGLTAVPAPDGRGLLLRWEDAEIAGIYRLVLHRRDGGDHLRLIAVNTDPHEGDLLAAEEEELMKIVGDLPVTYVKNLDDLDEAAGEARIELWRLFLFAALGTLMAEQCLAWWWGRRT